MSQQSVFEFRQYTLYGGKRDTLISIFEEHFVEPQEEVGSHVIGTFRDVDDPDRFVWIRGFEDMPRRAAALEAFYGGPVWKEYRQAANATMVDSDNVLLLKPAGSDRSVFLPSQADRPGVYCASIYYLNGTDPDAFARFFESIMVPWLSQHHVRPVAKLVSEGEPNNFPKLPVREREKVFLWLARWKDQDALSEFLLAYDRWSGWRDHAPVEVLPALMCKPEVIRLVPTTRSKLQ